MIQDSRSQRGRGIKRVFSKRIQINDEAQEVMLYAIHYVFLCLCRKLDA